MAGPWEKYSQSPQQITPGNPKLGGELTTQGQTIQRNAAELPYVAPKAAAETAKSQTDASVASATAPARISQETTKATREQVELQKLIDEIRTTGGAGAEQAKSGSFYTRMLRDQKLYGDKRYDETGAGVPTAGREFLLNVLPDSWVNEFTSPERQQAEALQRDFIGASLRYESGAAIPSEEFKTQRLMYFPQPGDAPETLALKRQLRENAIAGMRVAAGPSAKFAEQLPNEQDRLRSPTFAPATGKQTTEYDAQLSAAIDQLIRMGRSPEEITAFAKSKGASPPTNLAEAIAYARTNPQYKGGFTQATRTRPTTLGERVAGSAPSAYVAGAGTALSAGLNDEAAGAISALSGGDYAQGRDAFNARKALLRDAHPTADFLGNVTGTTLGMVAGGAGLDRLAQGGSRIAGALTARGGLGADAAYGAAYGAGENNDNRILGGALGGAAGGAGNFLGRGIANAVGGVVSPTGGAMRPLYDLGVRPSIGQRAGGVVNALEEWGQSIPGVGHAIRGTRDRARDQAELGIINDELSEFAKAGFSPNVPTRLPDDVPLGPKAHATRQAAENAAYDEARVAMRMIPDADFATDLGGLQRTVGQLTKDSQVRFNKIWQDEVARRVQQGGGVLHGEAYKKAQSELGKRIAKIRSNQNGDSELADALEQASMALDAAARRNSSPEAVAKLDAADAAYAKGVRIDSAANYAGGEPGRMTPSQYLRAVRNEDGSIRGRAFNSGNALNQDLATAFARLGDKQPNSNSAERFLVANGALGGGIAMEPSIGLPLALGYGAANLPGVRNITTGMMAPRGNKTLQDFADAVRRLEEMTGKAGAGIGMGTAGLLLPPR